MNIRKVISIIGVVVVIVTLAVVFGLTKSKQPPVKTVTATRQNIASEVAFTGSLTSRKKVQMAFELTGAVTEVAVDVGDKVKAGDVLMRLDTASAQLSAQSARAARLSGQEQARITWRSAETAWDKTRTENSAIIAKYQQDVRNAKSALDQGKNTLDQVVRESGDVSSTYKTKYEAVSAQASAYKTSQKTLEQTQANSVKTVQAARDAADSAYAKYAATVQASGNATGLSALVAAEQLAGVQLIKSVALAPFDGVVTARSVSSGELVISGKPVVTIETVDDLQIVANVPESDVTKLSVGLSSAFTLDAYAVSDNQFVATVVKIAPAAKIIEGVPTYEVTLDLNVPDARLKPGMTANVTVTTASKSDVVTLPRRSIAKLNGKNTVKIVQADGTTIDREVELGIFGSQGQVEITAGLTGGETVVLPAAGK